MNKTKELLDKYKCKNGNEALILLPIFDNSNEIIGYLRPITSRYKKTLPNCISTFSRWRRENPSISTGTFEITDERTEKWLDNAVINNDDRLIFFITDLSGELIGHIGLASFMAKECEVDSVLRGVKGTLKGMMSFALKAIINLAHNEFIADRIYLKVMSDNTAAINFYKNNSFVEDYLLPMVKVEYADEVRWEVSEDISLDTAERKYMIMKYTERDAK